ncbi:phage tailspike protein [Phytobacter ursingii]|uniref:phage tailspike protein n=1 Tax=Enterobacteriaceae TaxID=543 RepID=UPI00069BFC94|nr:phage tailspike protein [Phytobacter ursingii]
MTDITVNAVISMPGQLFTMARSFKAAANGKIYVGEIDTDPTNPVNQIQVYLENEDGSTVPVAQPLSINAGGYPVYNGEIAKFVTDRGHSMAVLDAYDVQQFYFPNVLKYDPDQFSSRLAGGGAEEGDVLVGVKQATPNSVLITQHDVNLQSVSIQQYGGKDDYNGTSGTNCWSALQAIFTDFPNGCKIRFPKTVGGTGRYYMNGTMTWPDMSKYIIDPDPGVDITHEGGGTPLIGAGLVVTRPLNIILPTLGYTYRLSPTPYGPLSGKPYFISSGDGESPVVEKIQANSELAFYAVNPATGASSGASASGDVDIVTFSNIPTGQFIVGSVPVRPGWEAHAQVTMPGSTASIAIYVQTERGFVIYSQPIGGGDITRYVFREGYPVQSVTIPNPVQDNPAYNFDVSEIGIKIHSPTSFSILCNHSEVARIEGLPYNIVRAGWGAGIANNTNAAYITYPVRVKNNKTYGMRPLRVVIVGDSTADKNNHLSWVNHMVRVSSGAGGLQFKNILNLAVAGQTAVQQAAIFNSTDFVALGGFDYAMIDVGINDIAGGSTADQFITAITSIVTTCQTYNITPIIGIPALWYNGSAAVPFGQSTGKLDSNAVRGASYRLRLLRTLSDLGVQVAMLPLQDMGAIVPSLLVHPELDPVVQDNLHQSGFGAQLKGGGWAKALIGYLFCRTRTNISPTEIIPGWIPSAISATYGVAVKPKFEVVGNEFGLTGLMDTPAPVPNNTTILQLPQAYAPLSQLYIPLTCFDVNSVPLQSVATLRIDTSGAFVVNNVPSTSRYFAFGNCRYNLPQ